MQNQMYAKSVIVFHHFKWPSEVSYPVVPNGKKKTLMEKKKNKRQQKISMFFPVSELFFAIFWVLGCLLMSPDYFQ